MVPDPASDASDIREVDSGRVAIIGAGHVGSTTAYALMLRALFREIVLIDNDAGLARAEARDVSDANALARPAHVWAGDYPDAARADIVIITAGAATQGAQSRLSIATRSAEIVRQCVTRLMAEGFSGIMIIAANPVDLMTAVAIAASGLEPARVIGTGTLLDSLRLQHALAHRLGVAPNAVHAMVIGEHGDSAVAAFSNVRIGGLPLSRFQPDWSVADEAQIATDVRNGAYRIIEGKGYTSFGVATAIVRICEAVVRNEGAILPASTQLNGESGISGICLSLPCILGASGIVRILEPDLDEAEICALHASAAIVRKALASLTAGDTAPVTDTIRSH
ncbi:L-lactate dehydrogenase [Sphingobium boeckii]|uniref:L-lactate dehydrogenase n=1 Tax=Sphingobium boeckii TaxID=1082345 RepID=A0A7W9AGX8_9SPHN|nr:L-lactate dehydrogenase [Sphingobium boeckii]MBB5685439.1 L-lactate dehydrogenase [Sphingobium boeckii]